MSIFRQESTRRSLLKGFAGVAGTALAGPWSARAQGGDAAQSLGQLAADKGLLFGSAITRAELTPESEVLFAREVHLITPAKDLLMRAVRPAPDSVQFADADTLVGFAGRHYCTVRGHALVTNGTLPDWVKTLPTSEIEALLDKHIESAMRRYEGRIRTWEVVDRPINPKPDPIAWLSPGPYLAAMGEDYIAYSFLKARASDVEARLFLNEANTERDDTLGIMTRQRLLRLVDKLRDSGVPIDGVGLTGHLDPAVPFDPPAFLAFCEEIARRNLEIHITELDVADASFPDDIAQRDAQVADVLAKFLGSALRCTAVTAVVTWHLSDAHSPAYQASLAKSPKAKRRPRPVLYDTRQQRKPAWHAVAKAFADMPARR